jgi:hypothetical protein
MRFMVFLNMKEGIGGPPQALVEEMGRLMAEGTANGTLLDTGGLYGTEDSKQISMRGGQVTVSDGPFAEAKEVVGGYAVIEVRDEAEAVEHARRIVEAHKLWPGWEGFAEVRRIAGPDDGPPPRS